MTLPNKNVENDETLMHVADTDDETVIHITVKEDETVMAQNPNRQHANKPKLIGIGSVLKQRFILKEQLGSGGMGTVFRATDLRREEAQDHQADVAIKVLNDEFKDDPELLIALQRETKKTQMLAHPNIVTVYDFDKDDSTVFMVMELLEGESLSQFISEKCVGGLAFKDSWHIIKGLALALAYAHKKNIIHSDFKPGNVFITSDGGVKVLDFGIACAAIKPGVDDEDTVFNARDLGALTPAYASLEMLQGKAPDPSDDVYALACVCYEILSGKHPYGKLSAQKALELNVEIPAIQLKKRQRLALQHALAFKKKDRTVTIDVFLNEIEPKSSLPKVLSIAAFVLISAVSAGYYYVFNEMNFVDSEIVQLSQEQELAVKDFLELAEIHFEVGYLTSPAGSNALWAYKEVLKLDPYNSKAQAGLKKIAKLSKENAEELYMQSQYKLSLDKVEEGLEAVPKNQDLLDLKNRILKNIRG